MVRKILEWCDKKQEESLKTDSELILLAKSGGLGAIEGAIDGFAISGVVAAIIGIIAIVKETK